MSGPTGRKLNRARTVKMIARLMHHACTKAELARHMGMSRTCRQNGVSSRVVAL